MAIRSMEQGYSDWRELNAKTIVCSAPNEGAKMGFEAGWCAALDHICEYAEGQLMESDDENGE